MSVDPKLSIIVAKSRNGVIGRDGDLPWRLATDLNLFKAVTMGKPILMGRVTWESLGRPLPGRPNLVLTHDAAYRAKGAEVFHDLPAMIGRGYELAGAMGSDEIMIIGGAKIYAASMEYVDRLYVTDVDTIIDGDAHFAAISKMDWKCVSETAYPAGPKDDFAFTVRIYERLRLKF